MLDQDFKEFIELLNDNDVRYLVVGGYAVAFHGYPRYTKDIDIWIELEPTNAQKIIAALEQFGFGSLGLTADDFLVEDQIVQLGYPPSRIDIVTSLVAVDFEECFAAREEAKIDDMLVSFIDVEALKRTKRPSAKAEGL